MEQGKQTTGALKQTIEWTIATFDIPVDHFASGTVLKREMSGREHEYVSRQLKCWIGATVVGREVVSSVDGGGG